MCRCAQQVCSQVCVARACSLARSHSTSLLYSKARQPRHARGARTCVSESGARRRDHPRMCVLTAGPPRIRADDPDKPPPPPPSPRRFVLRSSAAVLLFRERLISSSFSPCVCVFGARSASQLILANVVQRCYRAIAICDDKL